MSTTSVIYKLTFFQPHKTHTAGKKFTKSIHLGLGVPRSKARFGPQQPAMACWKLFKMPARVHEAFGTSFVTTLASVRSNPNHLCSLRLLRLCPGARRGPSERSLWGDSSPSCSCEGVMPCKGRGKAAQLDCSGFNYGF